MNMIGRLHITASETSLYGAFGALYNRIIAFTSIQLGQEVSLELKLQKCTYHKKP